MPALKNRLSVRVVTLTAILAVMATFAAISSISALHELSDEYEYVKQVYIQKLLKINQLRALSNQTIHLSTEIFLSNDQQDVEANYTEVLTTRADLEILFEDIYADSPNYKQLVNLKETLYELLKETSEVMEKKFVLTERFYQKYKRAAAYKRQKISNNNIDVAIIIDKAMSHVNPMIAQDWGVNKKDDIEALGLYIRSTQDEVSEAHYNELVDIFLGDSSVGSAYEDYMSHTKTVNDLIKANEALSIHIPTINKETLADIQQKLLKHIDRVAHAIEVREFHLYLLMGGCFVIALLLAFLQVDLLRRVHLIRQVIDAGYSHSQANIPINGKDEISLMAKAVKGYIDELLKKEQEISERNKQLTHIATHDGLTGVYNRRFFDSSFEQVHARYLRDNEKYCLAMFDLDFFKQVNDNYGHHMGDKVLFEFAKRVQKQVRKMDIFARFGGEEFTLLMPNTRLDDALSLMQRIRAVVNEAPCVDGGVEVHFTTSIGLVEVQPTTDMSQIEFADKALYEAKQTGRNKVCVYQAE